ncbi:AAA family ATPase [Chitinophagaceae bacterium MMS25-I14]
MKKIVVIGPESTGKSTLSAALAKELGTIWVPEYARGYLERLGRPYEERDLLQIAAGQLQSEDLLVHGASRFLVCDTDLYVVKVWSEHSYSRCHRNILEQIAVRPYDLYLLTYIDTKWEYDPLREHGEVAMRQYFYNQYRDIVAESGVPWADVRGNEQERLQIAMNAVKHHFLNA